MPDYAETVRRGAAAYADVLDLLRACGLPAELTQTGGMCAALEVVLDSGHTLLVTDAQGSLAWEREEHQGWGVGLYPPDQAHTDGECLAFDSTPDGSPAALLPLVDAVVGAYVRRYRG